MVAASFKEQPEAKTVTAQFEAAGQEVFSVISGLDGNSPRIIEISRIFEAVRKAGPDHSGFQPAQLAQRFGIDEVLTEKAFALLRAYEDRIAYRGQNPVDDYYKPMVAMIAGMRLDDTQGLWGASSTCSLGDSACRSVSTLSALLYDLVAQNLVSPDEIAQVFGEDIASLSGQLGTVTRVPITIVSYGEGCSWSKEDVAFNKKQHDLGQDLIYAMNDPAHSWLIKSTSALQQLRVMNKELKAREVERERQGLPPLTGEDRLRAEEPTIKRALHALGMYMPVAEELGNPFRDEMQDLLLDIIDPDAALLIKTKLELLGLRASDGSKGPAKAVVEQTKASLRSLLAGSDEGVEFNGIVEGRVKSAYSIWRKMLDKQNASEDEEAPILRMGDPSDEGSFFPDRFNWLFSEVHDILAFRVIQKGDDEAACKTLYSRVKRKVDLKSAFKEAGRSVYGHLRDRFKNYIEKPRDNGYKAIHDGFMINGRKIELQFVTEQMHIANSSSLCSHSAYKALDLGKKRKESEKGRDENLVVDPLKIHPTHRKPTKDNPEEYYDLIQAILRNASVLLGASEGFFVEYPPRNFKIVRTFVEDGKGGPRSDTLRKLPEDWTVAGLVKQIHSHFLKKASTVVIDGVPYPFQDIKTDILPHCSSVTLAVDDGVEPSASLSASPQTTKSLKKPHGPS